MLRDICLPLKTMLNAAVLVASLAVPVALGAAPDSPGRIKSDRVEALALAVENDTQALRSAGELLSSFGFDTDAPDLAFPAENVATDAPRFGGFDIRLSLGMLAQAFGHQDNVNVLDAQGGAAADALLLQSGRAALDDLPPSHVTRIGKKVTLHAPLVIWNDASLVMSPGEALLLDDASGAFILNHGVLQIDGAAVSSTGTPNAHDADFRPFIATTGGGVLRATNARFSDLGFGSTMKFSGLSIVRNALERPTARSFVADSVIQRVRSVTLHAANGAHMSGNRIIDAGSAALLIVRSRNTDVIGNVMSGPMTTNAIRVTDGSARTRVIGNAVLGGERAGILVKGASNDSEIRGNIVWNRNGGGIKVEAVHCARITGNAVIGNRQKGIELRRSKNARIDGNMLVSNRSAGIWISGQPKAAVTRVEGNTLDANGSGLATATAAAILLDGNDFSHQFPQFLAGDLVAQARYVAADMKGTAPIVLSAIGPVSVTETPDQCERGG